MPAHLEREPRTVGTADVDLLAVGNVDRGHAAAVDVQAVEAAIVDSDPAALIEPQDEVGARDQRVRDADVGTRPTTTSLPGAKVRVEPSSRTVRAGGFGRLIGNDSIRIAAGSGD